jgi:hypothetical protein
MKQIAVTIREQEKFFNEVLGIMRNLHNSRETRLTACNRAIKYEYDLSNKNKNSGTYIEPLEMAEVRKIKKQLDQEEHISKLCAFAWPVTMVKA